MTKLLLVEDQSDFADAVEDWLAAQGYVIDRASTGPEALGQLKVNKYDVVILDINLPGLSGVDVLRNFRLKDTDTPVIVLTGNRTIDDKELGFDAGADDYLTKPFQMRELSARLKSLLRRAAPATQAEELRVGDLVMDRKQHRVLRAGKEIELLPKEFALLEFLMQHPSEVFSAEALIQRVWRSSSEASPDTIRSYITRIRKKLGSGRDNPIIATVHGVGYKLLG